MQDSQSQQQQDASQAPQPQTVQHLDQLLVAISYRTLATASFACGAYARALQYLELHLRGANLAAYWPPAPGNVNGPELKMQTRSRYTGKFSAQDVDFLQSILNKLEESDALIGLATLRPERELPKPGADCPPCSLEFASLCSLPCSPCAHITLLTTDCSTPIAQHQLLNTVSRADCHSTGMCSYIEHQQLTGAVHLIWKSPNMLQVIWRCTFDRLVSGQK